jgi:hypothetical protein
MRAYRGGHDELFGLLRGQFGLGWHKHDRVFGLGQLARDDHTICTAVAPEAALTVRTWGINAAYSPGLVRKFSRHKPQTSRSNRWNHPRTRNVSQVRPHAGAGHARSITSARPTMTRS